MRASKGCSSAASADLATGDDPWAGSCSIAPVSRTPGADNLHTFTNGSSVGIEWGALNARPRYVLKPAPRPCDITAGMPIDPAS
jgi:hypothetical protein